MNGLTPADRQAIRDYLLDTLEPAERDRIEARILESPEWQEALEAERAALKILDELQDETPPRDLASRTVERVAQAAEAGGESKHLFGSWVTIAATIAIVGIAASILLPALSRSREAARRASTQNNMKQIGLALKMYANESPGELYPPMSRYKGLWMFDMERMYPKYITDLSILVDLRHPNANEIQEELVELAAADEPDYRRITELATLSFTYVGWAINNAEDANRVARAYAQLAPDQLDLDITGEDGTVYRLREGIERFLITDINNPAATAIGQSEIPIVVSHGLHENAPPQALYLDGHVETKRPGSQESWLDLFREAAPDSAQPD